MTKDISRLLTQTKKHYTGARLQQGRVLLDSDVNEAAKLGEEDRRRTLIDALGPKGSPDEGFSLRRPLDTTEESDALRAGDVLTAEPIAFNDEAAANVLPVAVRPGSLYAGGLRFDLDVPESLAFQRDFLQMRSDDAPTIEPDTPFRHLYYLDGWEQIVTPVEDQELGEAMLRGPDTSVRVRRMRRVQVFDASAVDPPTCSEAWAALVDHLEQDHATFDPRSHELVSSGRLQLVFREGESADPCSPVDPFTRRYLGAENQTLRIMLTSNVTYVWALDNAAPLFRVKVTGLEVTSPPSALTVTILNPPTDERHWPFKNRVVELIPFGALLDGGDVPDGGPHARKAAAEIGVFSRASATYDPKTQSFPIDDIRAQIEDLVHLWPHAPEADQAILAEPADANGARFFYMRLWHDALTPDQIEIAVSDDPDDPALGDTGVVPVFHADGRPGDFWVATLRTDAPAQVQPFDLLHADGVPPHGPHHFIAPLALLAADVDPSDPPNATVTMVRDCRPRLRPLTERCPTLTVGDGVHSFGDFTTIADALQHLPDEGGIISVRPGVYAAPVSIVNRKNITIEGCGDATIIESQFSAGEAVILITNSSTDIHISSLRIHASDEPGVVVKNGSHNITLDSLHVISGTLGTEGFEPGGSAPFAQVQFIFGSTGSLNNLKLEPNRQIGLQVESTDHVSITGLDARGLTGIDDGFTTPLVLLRGLSTVSLVESTLVGIGQVPLRVESLSGCKLSDLSVTSQPRTSASLIPTNIYPAAVIRFVNDLVLQRSSLRMENGPSLHAVLSLQGGPIRIEKNEIVADGGAVADAWGGIHVRGGSSNVRIIGNNIRNGYGHGITLGGVEWASETSTRIGTEGPGQGQTEGSSGAFSVTGFLRQFSENNEDFLPGNDEGPISQLVIADNLITQMGTNGISALTVAGLGDSNLLLMLLNVTIERNTIRNNVLRPSSNVPDVFLLPFPTSTQGTFLTMSVLPFGGIALASAEFIDIRDNIIVANGTASGVLPMNGIFVLTGDSATIENNRIQENGARAFDESVPVRSGVRAGIAVMLAGAGTLGSTGAIDSVLSGFVPLDNNGLALRICGNTVSHPEGRALHAVGIGPFQIEGNFLSALGNQGGDDAVEQFAIGELVYVQNLGGPFDRFELAQFQNTPTFTTFPTRAFETLLDQVPTSPRLYLGGGGQIQFNNNHTVFDWSVTRTPTPGAPLSFFPVVLLTLDHLGMLGNHLALRVQGNALAGLPLPHPNNAGDAEAFAAGFAFEPILSHILAAGVTLNVQLNRISESVRASYLSLLANADLLNYTAYNQTTHDVLSMRTHRLDTREAFERFAPTQVIYHVAPGLDASAEPPTPNGDGRVRERLRFFMREFLQLTFAFQR